MGCCIVALFSLISPRLALFFVWIFSDLLSDAYDSWIVPLLGFFLLPWTTLTYAAFWDWGDGRHVSGFEWFFVILAFVVDLGSYVSGDRARTPRTAAPDRRGRRAPLPPGSLPRSRLRPRSARSTRRTGRRPRRARRTRRRRRASAPLVRPSGEPRSRGRRARRRRAGCPGPGRRRAAPRRSARAAR